MLDIGSLGKRRNLGDLLAFDRFVLFGAGGTCKPVVEYLRQENKQIVSLFDNNPRAVGETRFGCIVRSPDELKRYLDDKTAVVISCAAQCEVAKQLVNQLGVAPERLFPYMFQGFRGHYDGEILAKDWNDIEWLASQLADQESLRYLVGLLACRWQLSPLPLVNNPLVRDHYLYDRPEVSVRPNDVVVDCGAYIGDTAQLFLNRTENRCRVVCLEPFENNFATLQTWAQTQSGRVVPIRAAAGDSNGELHLNLELLGGSGAPGAAPETRVDAIFSTAGTGYAVPMRTIDSVLTEANERVDFIKMDIEGGEAGALRGGAESIRRYRPTLAISAYHLAADVWALSRLIDNICRPARIYLGHNVQGVLEPELYVSYR